MNQGVKTFALLATFIVVTGSLLIIALLPTMVTRSLINDHINYERLYEAKDYGVQAQALTLRTEDGLRLAAWEVNVLDPKAVIIFLGGLNDPSVTAFWGHARILAEHGYASLLVELRAHGLSEGEQIGLGYTEHLDVKAALRYIKAQEATKDVPVIAFGADLGGVAAINAVGVYPDLAGAISIGAYSSWADLFRDNLYFSGAPLLLAMVEKPFVHLYTLAKFGISNRTIQPQRQIAQIGSKPVLLMHSEDDEYVSSINLDRILQRAPRQVEAWLRPGSEHLVAKNFLEPEEDHEYMERILAFLEFNFSS